MAIDSVASFVDVIRQNQLLEAGQLSELANEARKASEPRQLAQLLIKKNLLTPYQVNQVFGGQAASLVLGQYRVLERLGEGGMGQVFKARHQAMGRIVALKVIRKDQLQDDEAVRRFEREIRSAAQLHHPNVVIAFDADAVGATHFYAMEYVDGTDLSRLVKQVGPLPVAVACNYVQQAALGLQHAHARGLIHRDIKPGNLLVTRADSAPNGAGGSGAKRARTTGAKPIIKIMDMGLARTSFVASGPDGTAISQDGAVIGTPDFMAPEQAANNRGIDHRADIYSLGCTFYYLLTGQVPFPGGTSFDKLVHHQKDMPRPVEKFRADVPPKVRALLQKMLAKRPEDRIQSAGEVAAALAPFADGASALKITRKLPIIRAPAGTVTTTLQGVFAVDVIRRHRWLALGLALAALIGLVGTFIVVVSLLPG